MVPRCVERLTSERLKKVYSFAVGYLSKSMRYDSKQPNSLQTVQRLFRLRFILLAVMCFTPLVGCGPSKEDLIMRAAQRKRPKDPSESPPKKPANKPKPAAPANQPPSAKATPVQPPPSGRMEVVAEKAAEKTDDTPEVEKKPLLTVEERKAQAELDEGGRRSWAVENITKVSEALEKYYQTHGSYPRRFSETQSKLATLSWRVSLLPYLGYQELYEKFDFEKPWYMEPNKSLLQYIPKEYISPERFDTKTNIQLPAGRLCVFESNQPMTKNAIEDGVNDTILLIEVDDRMAVEWTSPNDFEPGDLLKMKGLIGGLRKDGTFAVWANGWPFLMSNKTTPQQMRSAFTYESGDIPVSGKIHQPLMIEKLSTGAVAAKETPMEDPKSLEDKRPMPPAPEPIVRDPVPVSIEVEEAMDRLRQVYALDISNAVSNTKKVNLAKKMLEAADSMQENPADAYALMIAAGRMAESAGAADVMVDAVDQRVGRFELDAYEENVNSLIQFADNARATPEEVGGADRYNERAMIVIYAAATENDFTRASKIARYCARLIATQKTGETPLSRMMNRLSSQLSNARGAYEQAKEHLTTIRINPEDNEAKAKFGQFLCFLKGDWDNGLPLLANTTNSDLANVVQQDMSRPTETAEQIELADSWWNLSQRAGGIYRQAAQDRAVMWYELALGRLPESLDRMHVENRLHDAGKDEPSSPLAMIEKLAKELGADLTTNLASLANGQYKARKSPRGKYDDEDD